VPPNKGMKQTSVERIGRSQLIPGVLRTCERSVRPELPDGSDWITETPDLAPSEAVDPS